MANPQKPAELLHAWLKRHASPEAMAWLEEKLAAFESGVADRDLYLAVSLAPRKMGKADLALAADDFAEADRVRRGWTPLGWTVDQAARLLLLLVSGGSDAQFAARLDALCRTADVGELITFYRGLPLYPAPERHLARAAEGARTNMKAVFNAVAHHNPYPFEQFPEQTWNHMVLKALFIDSPLHPIQGLDERANPSLMRMLCDYAHERWAARRPVSPELWRCVGPYADDAAIADLERVLGSEDERERLAAALALAASPHPRAAAVLDQVPELRAGIESRQLSWDTVAQYPE